MKKGIATTEWWSQVLKDGLAVLAVVLAMKGGQLDTNTAYGLIAEISRDSVALVALIVAGWSGKSYVAQRTRLKEMELHPPPTPSVSTMIQPPKVE